MILKGERCLGCIPKAAFSTLSHVCQVGQEAGRAAEEEKGGEDRREEDDEASMLFRNLPVGPC